MPLAEALVIGPDDGIPIVEFTDPDCPYCRYYQEHLVGIESPPIKRYIFFETRPHPAARQKAVHILCADDPAAAFDAVYRGARRTFATCAAGEARHDRHLAILSAAGVSATPTVYLGRTPVRGFQPEAIDAYRAEASAATSEKEHDATQGDALAYAQARVAGTGTGGACRRPGR